MAAQIVIAPEDSSSPSGLIWDRNYSCAYDALLTILYEVWSADTKAWQRRFKENQLAPSQVTVCFFQTIYEWSGKL